MQLAGGVQGYAYTLYGLQDMLSILKKGIIS